jgi:hypothetical protein
MVAQELHRVFVCSFFNFGCHFKNQLLAVSSWLLAESNSAFANNENRMGEKLEPKTKLNPLDAPHPAIGPQPTYRDHPMPSLLYNLTTSCWFVSPAALRWSRATSYQLSAAKADSN